MAPQRRCVGCGRVAAKNELLRLALAPAQTRRAGGPSRGRRADRASQHGPSAPPAAATVVLDRDTRLPGRGAYLCREDSRPLPRQSCFERAQRRGGIARTLRTPVKIDWCDLVESVGR